MLLIIYKFMEFDSLIFSAELGSDTVPVLDLHGLSQDQAKHEVLDFLSREHAGIPRKDYKVVKIIAGSGSGAIQRLLTNILTKNSLNFIVHHQPQTYPVISKAVLFVVLAPNTPIT